MFSNLDHFVQLKADILQEEKEQKHRYQLGASENLKKLKQDGLVLHPLKVINKTYGFADYPEVYFQTLYPIEGNQFRDSSTVEVFCGNETPVKGIVLQNEGRKIWVRLFAPEWMDWLEDPGVGIKLSPDERTTQFMLKSLENTEKWLPDFFNLNWQENENQTIDPPSILNESQNTAVQNILNSTEKMHVLHGPPGTGKSTTLVQLIQLAAQQKNEFWCLHLPTQP